ncbi:MAG: hypothetical protein AAF429_02660 [Pseudomonadota bacterium]
MQFDSKTKIRLLAFIISLPVLGLAAVAISVPDYQFMIAHGPIQKGHANVDCSGCHVPATGTTRQQVQANFKRLVGLREDKIDFGFAAVNSETCLNCHERPNERHPIYRFNEPRFQQARAEVAATSCLGCHSEHSDARVMAEVGQTFCVHCHEDLVLKNDPLDQSHVALIEAGQWGSCLGCHDFHGNHAHKAQIRVADAFGPAAIKAYLGNGPSPFGTKKIYEAKEK